MIEDYYYYYYYYYYCYYSRRMRWTGHVARMGREEGHTGFWWGNLRKRGHLEELGVD